MDAKDFLRRYEKYDYILENKLAELKRCRDIATNITAQMGGERVQTSGSQQRMADAVDKMVDIEKEVLRCVENLYIAEYDILNVIEQLNIKEYDVLHKKYVQYLTFDEIAAIKNKAPSSIKGTHGTALRNVQKILDEREKRKACVKDSAQVV